MFEAKGLNTFNGCLKKALTALNARDNIGKSI